MRSLDVDGLLVPVVNRPYFASFPNALRRSLACEVARLLLQLSVLIESLLKRRSHGIAFQQADSSDQVILLVLCGWKVLKINLDAEIVALLWLDDVRAIFAFEHSLGAVCHQFGEAFYGDGDENLGLDVWCGDVESDIVEV
jgi:hypothetical protein